MKKNLRVVIVRSGKCAAQLLQGPKGRGGKGGYFCLLPYLLWECVTLWFVVLGRETPAGASRSSSMCLVRLGHHPRKVILSSSRSSS